MPCPALPRAGQNTVHPARRAAALHPLWRSAAASLLTLCLGLPALAQAWPTKAVTLMVPWPAGGPSDFVARQIQPDTQKALGQPLVIENLGGVGGAMGVQKVQAATDGHSALLGSPLELIIPPLTLGASVHYKPADFRLVAQVVKAPLVLVARKDLPADTLDELLALSARQKGKPLAMANTGPGSMFHLVGEKFAQQAGLPLLQVPYKGATPALTDLLGGQVDLMFTIFGGAMPAMIASGKIKAIGLATAQPLPGFAVPALAAHPRMKGFEFDSWGGVLLPRKAPEEAVARLNQAVYEALRNPQVRQAFESAGNQVVAPTPPAELERIYQAEIARYAAIARSIQLQPQPAGQ